MMINLLALWIMDHLVVHIIEHLIKGRSVITDIMASLSDWKNDECKLSMKFEEIMELYRLEFVDGFF